MEAASIGKIWTPRIHRETADTELYTVRYIGIKNKWVKGVCKTTKRQYETGRCSEYAAKE
jgi:hypothetical protein